MSEDGLAMVCHNGLVIVALADGVSAELASHSGEGARLATTLAVQAVARGLDAGLDKEQATAEAFSYVHNTLTDRTRRQNGFWGMYACTLAVAIIDGEVLTVGHVGDSSAYTFDGKRLTRIATAPVQSQPTTIIHPNWRDVFTSQSINKPYIRTFALTTDGAESFFMGRKDVDGPCTNPAVTEAITKAVDTLPTSYAVAAVISNLLQHTDYIKLDDRTMFWAIKKKADQE